MFRNLDAEMARKGISKSDIAECLEVRYATVIDKTKGRSQFSIAEAFKIQEKFFPDCSLEYLFSRDDQQKARDETSATSA